MRPCKSHPYLSHLLKRRWNLRRHAIAGGESKKSIFPQNVGIPQNVQDKVAPTPAFTVNVGQQKGHTVETRSAAQNMPTANKQNSGSPALGDSACQALRGSGFDPMRRPRRGDWLAEHKERGQSFVSFQRLAFKATVHGSFDTVALVVLGAIDDFDQSTLDSLRCAP